MLYNRTEYWYDKSKFMTAFQNWFWILIHDMKDQLMYPLIFTTYANGKHFKIWIVGIKHNKNLNAQFCYCTLEKYVKMLEMQDRKICMFVTPFVIHCLSTCPWVVITVKNLWLLVYKCTLPVVTSTVMKGQEIGKVIYIHDINLAGLSSTYIY